MTPSEYYHKQVISGEMIADPLQTAIIDKFDHLYFSLVKNPPEKGIFKFLKKTSPTKGIYLWGNVGAGKTHLMNLFFWCLPFENKLRIHFHEFMKTIHEKNRDLSGTRNPLSVIAKDLAKKYRIICFDELVIHDIADAMLLGELFKAMFLQGMILVITSNSPPDNLYQKGLQRERFLPAISLIKKYLDVCRLETADDYRQRFAKTNPYFLYDHFLARQQLQKIFEQRAGVETISKAAIIVNDRPIQIEARTEEIIWFQFEAICGIPRSQQDYLELVKKYTAFFISDLHALAVHQYDLIRSLINLIDVLYDHNIKLVISSFIPLESIYTEGKFLKEFERTKSRMYQMTTKEWAEDYFSP